MQTQVRQLPPGLTPPLVIKYSASSIPVVQLGLSSPTRTEQSVFDTAINILRPQLITIPGVALFVLVLAINLLGDGVRDLTSPEVAR